MGVSTRRNVARSVLRHSLPTPSETYNVDGPAKAIDIRQQALSGTDRKGSVRTSTSGSVTSCQVPPPSVVTEMLDLPSTTTVEPTAAISLADASPRGARLRYRQRAPPNVPIVWRPALSPSFVTMAHNR